VKSPPLKKDIETINVFHLVDDNTIRAYQRTATFLTSQDPRYELAFARDSRVKTIATDVRRYDIQYKRL
jgi:hypothetical protein